MTGPNPELTPDHSGPPQGESEARDPREVIDIYLADSLDNIATVFRILAVTPPAPESRLTARLTVARAALEKARQTNAEEADSA